MTGFSTMIETQRWRTSSLVQSVRRANPSLLSSSSSSTSLGPPQCGTPLLLLYPSIYLLLLLSTLSVDDVIWLFCVGWQTHWACTGVSVSSVEWCGDGAMVHSKLPSSSAIRCGMVSLYISSLLSPLFFSFTPFIPFSISSPLPSLLSFLLLSSYLFFINYISSFLLSFQMRLTHVRHGHACQRLQEVIKRRWEVMKRRWEVIKEEMRSEEGGDGEGDKKADCNMYLSKEWIKMLIKSSKQLYVIFSSSPPSPNDNFFWG